MWLESAATGILVLLILQLTANKVPLKTATLESDIRYVVTAYGNSKGEFRQDRMKIDGYLQCRCKLPTRPVISFKRSE